MEQEILPPVEQVVEPIISEISPKKWPLYLLITFVGIFATSTAIFAALYFEIITIPSRQSVELSPSSTPFASAMPLATPSPAPASDITWLTKPEMVATYQLTKPQEELPSESAYYLTNETEYTVVGTMKDGTKVVSVAVPCEGMSCDLKIYCLVSKTSSSCLKSGLNEYELKIVPTVLKSSVALVSTEVKGITAPKTLKVKGDVTLHLGNRSGTKLADIPKAELFEETEYGKLYRGFTPLMESSDLVGRNFYLLLGDQSLFTYSYIDKPYNHEADNGLTPGWANGSSSTEVMTQSLASGCGSAMWGAVPVYRGNLAKTILVATAPNGDKLYQSDTTNDATLLYNLYQFYKQGRDGGSASLLSLDEFKSNSDVYVLWKDTLGDWQVFMSNTYAPMVECGKPVMYLYPTQTMPVSVQVGALINKSEPLYPDGGWSVIADPDGKLSYQGKVYDSLFWEGKGDGVYPDYRNQGIVVRQSELVSSLHQQLTALGLNKVEQADFMEFWQPRLPETPYVRLTWLGTREMDVLAPLSVSPQPDTSIRVFLEFEGLSSFRKITPQRLSAPARKGFTLVEWGGLLVGESESRKQ